MNYTRPMPKRHKHEGGRNYTDDFKDWAVEQSEQAPSVEGFAEGIGVSHTALHKWRKKAGVVKSPKSNDEFFKLAEELEAELVTVRAERNELRATVAELREELRTRNALATELERRANEATTAQKTANKRARELAEDLVHARERIAGLEELRDATFEGEDAAGLVGEVKELRAFALQVIRAGVRAGTVTVDFTKGKQ